MRAYTALLGAETHLNLRNILSQQRLEGSQTSRGSAVVRISEAGEGCQVLTGRNLHFHPGLGAVVLIGVPGLPCWVDQNVLLA